MRSTDPDLALTDSVGCAVPVVAVLDIGVALFKTGGFVATLIDNFAAIEGIGLAIVSPAGITGFVGIVIVFIFVGATTACDITGVFVN